MICLENVCMRFGDETVVDQVSCTVAEGQTLVLIGPSGCGKSTILRLVAGLLTASSGRVSVGGVAVGPETRAAIRNRLGYVIQDGGLFPHLSAADNITITARFRGLSPAEARRRLAELAEMTHFPREALDRFPAQLSGGQRQRVGLMRALMPAPDVLLLDEPLGALDPMVRYDLQRDLRDIFRSLARTVLFVTHDLHEADYFADEMILLRAGRIEQRGTSRDLIRKPASEFVTSFLQAQRAADFGAPS